MASGRTEWRLLEDTPSFVEAVVGEFINELARMQRPAAIILAGGNTPRPVYRKLAGLNINWQDITLIPSDERCLPLGDADRNDTMILKNFISAIPQNPPDFVSIPANLGAKEGVKRFAQILSQLPPPQLSLLGMGEDGHTASLFPGNPALTATDWVVPVHQSPKPPAERISLSLPYLNRNNTIFILATGEAKREALQRFYKEEDLPVTRLHPKQKIIVFTDINVKSIDRLRAKR